MIIHINNHHYPGTTFVITIFLSIFFGNGWKWKFIHQLVGVKLRLEFWSKLEKPPKQFSQSYFGKKNKVETLFSGQNVEIPCFFSVKMPRKTWNFHVLTTKQGLNFVFLAKIWLRKLFPRFFKLRPKFQPQLNSSYLVCDFFFARFQKKLTKNGYYASCAWVMVVIDMNYQNVNISGEDKRIFLNLCLYFLPF